MGLALGASACAILATIVALGVLLQTLPESDGAHGMGLLGAFRDPMLLFFCVPIAALGAGLGFVLGRLLLWHTRLAHSIPFVTLITVIAAVPSGLLHMFGALPTFFAAVLAMRIAGDLFALDPPLRPRPAQVDGA